MRDLSVCAKCGGPRIFKVYPSGSQWRCMPCTTKASSDHHLGPGIEKHRERGRRWKDKHREAVRASGRAYSRTAHGRSVRTAYKQNPEEKQKNLARSAVSKAVASGKIARPDHCVRCSKTCTPQGHHHLGYARKNWLTVTWLCVPCHEAEHHSD